MGLNSFQTSGNSPGQRDERCSVGILGFGTIGSAIARRLTGPDAFPSLQLSHICDRRARERQSRQPDAIQRVAWTDRFDDLLTSDVDVIVEVVSGVEPAIDYVRAALLAGKSVVTANRLVIAHQGPALLSLAERQGRQLRFGAAVGGALPIVRALSEGLVGDRVRRIDAILSSTSNAILSQMESTGCELDEAIAGACAAGYTESDPSADLEGVDAACKLTILCALAFGVRTTPDRIDLRTTARVGQEAFRKARLRGGTIRQVAHAEYDSAEGVLCAWVSPIFVPATSVFARAHGPDNAAVIAGIYGGEVTMTGTGAGPDAIAVSVLGDLVVISRDRAAIVPALSLVEPKECQGLSETTLAEAV